MNVHGRCVVIQSSVHCSAEHKVNFAIIKCLLHGKHLDAMAHVVQFCVLFQRPGEMHALFLRNELPAASTACNDLNCAMHAGS